LGLNFLQFSIQGFRFAPIYTAFFSSSYFVCAWIYFWEQANVTAHNFNSMYSPNLRVTNVIENRLAILFNLLIVKYSASIFGTKCGM